MIYRTCRVLALGFLAVLLSTDAAFGAAYKIDTAHSSVGFSVRHIVSRTKGRFNDFKGQIVYDEANPSASSVSAKIQIASIDTDNERQGERSSQRAIKFGHSDAPLSWPMGASELKDAALDNSSSGTRSEMLRLSFKPSGTPSKPIWSGL